MEQELPALIAQGATLVCALVEPCRYEKVPVLELVQWGMIQSSTGRPLG